jgi:hypothetical protein
MHTEHISLAMLFGGLERSRKKRRSEFWQTDGLIVIEARGSFRCRFLAALGQAHS